MLIRMFYISHYQPMWIKFHCLKSAVKVLSDFRNSFYIGPW